MVKLLNMALLALTLAVPALACEACQDRDAFKNSFVSSANAAAAASSPPPAAVEAAAPQAAAPRDRSIQEPPKQAPVKAPSVRFRSFNDLR